MNKIIVTTAVILSATSATAGGFEASRLDTKFMYEEGNYAEVSHGSLDYDVQATTLRMYDATPPFKFYTGKENSVKTSQSRTSISFKAAYGNVDVGLSRYKSGTIQLAGSAATYSISSQTCAWPKAPQTKQPVRRAPCLKLT